MIGIFFIKLRGVKYETKTYKNEMKNKKDLLLKT